MTVPTKDQVLNDLVRAQDLIEKGYEILNDTGDYESEELDKCASLAKDLIDRMNTTYRVIHNHG